MAAEQEIVSKDVVNEVLPEGNENQNIPEPSQAEIEARNSGWVPKEEYEGDEHKWVDAGEFIRRGELFSKIDRQNKELKEVKKSLQLLADHNNKIKASAYKDALETLKAQKKTALIDGDPDAVVELDEKISDLKEAEKDFHRVASSVPQQETEISPVFTEWTSRNSWYVNDEPLKGFADGLGRQLAAKGLSPVEVLKEVEKRVREEFPSKFRNPNKDKPGAVETTSGKGRTSSAFVPSEVERSIAAKFVRQGVFKNVQDYYKQLQDMEKK